MHARRARTAFLTLAFAVLSLALLRPVCDALAAQAMSVQPLSAVAHGGPIQEKQDHGAAHSPVCCVMIEHGVLAKPSPVTSSGADSGRIAAYPPFAYLASAARRPRLDSAPDAIASADSSFYARSARIRR